MTNLAVQIAEDGIECLPPWATLIAEENRGHMELIVLLDRTRMYPWYLERMGFEGPDIFALLCARKAAVLDCFDCLLFEGILSIHTRLVNGRKEYAWAHFGIGGRGHLRQELEAALRPHAEGSAVSLNTIFDAFDPIVRREYRSFWMRTDPFVDATEALERFQERLEAADDKSAVKWYNHPRLQVMCRSLYEIAVQRAA